VTDNIKNLNGSNEQIRTIKKDLSSLEQKELDLVQYDSYISYYRVPLAIAILLLMAEILISNKKTRAFVNWKIFNT